MVPSKKLVNHDKLKVAYPTIVLFVVAITGYAFGSIAAVQGYLSITWAILINSFMAYLLFTTMHEAGHSNISGNDQSLGWLNEFIGWFSGITILSPFYLFKVIHFRHHAFTNDPEKDPDHWLASKSWFSLIIHSTTIFPVYIIKGIHLLFFEKKIVKRVKRELIIGYVGLFVFAIIFIAAGLLTGWSWVLQLWIVPAFIAQIFLAITFDWLPHHPHEHKERYLNTRVFDIPGLSIILLGQNYHLIHHLHPRIPFYNYKKVYSEIQDELIAEGTEIISVVHK